MLAVCERSRQQRPGRAVILLLVSVRRFGWVVGCVVLVRASSAAAQESADATMAPTSATAPLEAQLRGDPRPSPWAMRLAEADLRRVELERTQAWTLLAWGAANIVEGATLLVPWAGSGDAGARERTMGYGITTAAFGAVNLALAIPWVVRLPRERERAQRWQRLNERELSRDLERARDEARNASAFFALNTGLDVAYLTAGSLLLYMGERAETRSPTLSGIGISLLVQATALLAFDAWGWAARNGDSARFRDAARPSAD